MHWLAKRPGWLVREASHGRQWKISPLHSSGRVDLTLTHWTSDGFAVETKVAQCMTAAEAQMFAAALDNAGHPVGTKIDDLLIGKGFQEAPQFSRDVQRQVMEAVCNNSPDGHRYMHHDRRWFGSEDLSVFITTTGTGVFPFYCMIMSDGKMALPDMLMIEPRLFRLAPSAFARNAGTADPVIPTFTVASIAILYERLELNGSYAARLEDGQQHVLVELFAAGYNWPEEETEPEPLMLGMGR
ncbi:hypothetical protein [Devosia sp. Naph2]|uniref:hypothetical protein n=1 Tax=Devosia polycyclovorans TaxID=3345148 RepID=UPI0035CF9E02